MDAARITLKENKETRKAYIKSSQGDKKGTKQEENRKNMNYTSCGYVNVEATIFDTDDAIATSPACNESTVVLSAIKLNNCDLEVQ
jgi:hypothetical protein